MLRVLILLSTAFVAQAAEAATGVFREQAIPGAAGGATQLVVLAYSDWWFTEYDANRIGMMTRDGQFREFVVPTPDSGPRGITFGDATRAIWFTEFKAGKIGKLTYDGVFTEYVIPSPQSAPWGIAEIGGDVWFTESAANKIGHLNRDGTITEFAIPAKNASPRGIVGSHYGDVCFAEFGADQIGCLESGQLVERSLIPGSGPQELRPGYGGVDMWFTEVTGNRIGFAGRSGGRSLAQASIKEFAISTPASGAFDVTADISGAWFTERSSGQIGFVSYSGVITEYPLSDRTSQPTGIGPSLLGARFLESSANRVVEIQPDAVLISAGSSGRWETQLEFANVGVRPAAVFVGVYPQPVGTCPDEICPPQVGALLPPNGSGSAALGASRVFGLRTFYVRNLEEGILPAVRARIYNRDLPSQSADLPTIRLSTLTSLNPATLSFPGAVRNGSARTNLLISELSIDSLILDSPVRTIRTRVDLIGADGVLVASAEFDVPAGLSLYIGDIIGRLGVSTFQDGQIRVTKLGNEGLLWGYLARIDSEGAVSIFSGINP